MYAAHLLLLCSEPASETVDLASTSQALLHVTCECERKESIVQVFAGGRSSSKVAAIVSKKAMMRHSYRSCTWAGGQGLSYTPYAHFNMLLTCLVNV